MSLAFGGEWREENIDGFVETQYQSGWLYGNYLVTKGDYHVTEGYVETVVPLWDGLQRRLALHRLQHLGECRDLEGGPDVSARRGRDVTRHGLQGYSRAQSQRVVCGGHGAHQHRQCAAEQSGGAVRTKQTGSLALVPEEAESLGIGVVITPSFAPGLAFSVDYFDIEIEDAIGTVTAQNTVDLCFEQNVQSFCDNISYISVGDVQQISEILLVPFNFASQRTKGLDIEASYRLALGHGDVSLRGLATHYIENITDNGIDFRSITPGRTRGRMRRRAGAIASARLMRWTRCRSRGSVAA